MREAAADWQSLSQDHPPAAHALKVRMVRSGCWTNIQTVLSNTVAKQARLAESGTDEFNEAQWKDRMSARSADPKQCQRCWDNSVDMAGSSYVKKLCHHRVERIIVDRPRAKLTVKSVEEALETPTTRQRLGKAALQDAFAPSSLGFTTNYDGSRRLKRSLQFCPEDAEHLDDYSGGGPQERSRKRGRQSVAGSSVDRPSGSRQRPMATVADDDDDDVEADGDAKGIRTGSGGGDDDEESESEGQHQVPTPVGAGRRGRKSVVVGGWTPPANRKVRSADDVLKDLTGFKQKVVSKDAVLQAQAYYLRAFVVALVDRDWIVVHFLLYYIIIII